MARALLSSDWYRIAPLKPRLRNHVEIHRQQFRGETWFVVQDHHTGRYHRITPAANFMLSMMNGRRRMHDIWEEACARHGDDPPTQGETIRLLGQLHGADLIATDGAPDVEELGRRHAQQARSELIARVKNPLAIRLPLFDPDRFLNATAWLLRPLFTPAGFVAWLALVLAGLVLAVMNWGPLTGSLADRVLSADNLLLMALAYPLVKAVHEMGHAYAAKVWGGEVHEIGIMVLVFMPVPYVDASASSAFASKWRRAVVGGAGIMVELALASLALIFWLNAEPGLARAFAWNVMLIGGVSTLLFNGNPLLRFDGYFVFSDLIEIPGLGQRSNKYFWYLVQRYLLRLDGAQSPVTGRGEAKWLFTYAVAAFLYRIFISFAIALFIASRFFVIGILLAIWALFNTFVLPVWKGLKWLATTPGLRGRRWQGWAVLAGGVGLVGALLFAVPVPYATVAHGVVWLDSEALLRPETAGTVEAATEGPTETGAPVLRLTDPTLDGATRLAEARLEETRLRLQSVLVLDRVQADVLREQIRLLESRLADTARRSQALTVAATGPGRVVIPQASDLPGQRLEQGEVVGYLLDDSPMRLRVAVGQDRAELVRTRTEAVALRFEDAIADTIPARLIAELPESRAELPSLALATEGGGDFALNPEGASRLATVESVFQFEVAPLADRPVAYVGNRALVRFDHGDEPLGWRMLRAVRQLFLRQFSV
ncbi:peptidase M50 [Roseobacter sp. HKCCA0434]|uniref:peptidase M50 n=1 Tax=Roseobacter sp. HKCCA0434 TaxID=3079297 RepID=UPI002905BBA0|nr:peptidase M50 [Roseobacter sp. HKCCA0434]